MFLIFRGTQHTEVLQAVGYVFWLPLGWASCVFVFLDVSCRLLSCFASAAT